MWELERGYCEVPGCMCAFMPAVICIGSLGDSRTTLRHESMSILLPGPLLKRKKRYKPQDQVDTHSPERHSFEYQLKRLRAGLDSQAVLLLRQTVTLPVSIQDFR